MGGDLAALQISAMEEDESSKSLVYSMVCVSGSRLITNGFQKPNCSEHKAGIYELKKGDFSIKVTNYGARIVSANLPDKNGGRKGFGHVIWKVKKHEIKGPSPYITLSYYSADGKEGSQEVQQLLEHVDICYNHEECEACREQIKMTKGFLAKGT